MQRAFQKKFMQIIFHEEYSSKNVPHLNFAAIAVVLTPMLRTCACVRVLLCAFILYLTSGILRICVALFCYELSRIIMCCRHCIVSYLYCDPLRIVPHTTTQHSDSVSHTTTHCPSITLHHTTPHRTTLVHTLSLTLQHTTPHHNTLQHTTAHSLLHHPPHPRSLSARRLNMWFDDGEEGILEGRELFLFRFIYFVYFISIYFLLFLCIFH